MTKKEMLEKINSLKDWGVEFSSDIENEELYKEKVWSVLNEVCEINTYRLTFEEVLDMTDDLISEGDDSKFYIYAPYKKGE